MTGDKNNERESDIPAGSNASVTASVFTRARKRYQQLIIRSQGRLGKWIIKVKQHTSTSEMDK
jgi:hypothetical protein